MNFQCDMPSEPLRVLMFNSLSESAKYLAIKILKGDIFGKNLQINMILMVYTEDLNKAKNCKFELDKCAFTCTNIIEVSTVLPSISDADVFCFLTNFPNPNKLDFANIKDEQFEMVNLIINVANNLCWPEEKLQEEEETIQKQAKRKGKVILPEKEVRKPIVVADGMVALDILKSFSNNLPSNSFFCATPIPTIAKTVLARHLKVQCKVLNNVYVWAANDEIFHAQFEEPLMIEDGVAAKAPMVQSTDTTRCKDTLGSFNLDCTQFSPSWLKKDFISKTVAIAQKNPYGNIYMAALMAKTLQQIWHPRLTNEKCYVNMGVISDGSLDTDKGIPYVLPVVIKGDKWSVNTLFEEDIHLKREIKLMNKAAKEYHKKLISYCMEQLRHCVTFGSSLSASVDDDESTGSVSGAFLFKQSTSTFTKYQLHGFWSGQDCGSDPAGPCTSSSQH